MNRWKKELFIDIEKCIHEWPEVLGPYFFVEVLWFSWLPPSRPSELKLCDTRTLTHNRYVCVCALDGEKRSKECTDKAMLGVAYSEYETICVIWWSIYVIWWSICMIWWSICTIWWSICVIWWSICVIVWWSIRVIVWWLIWWVIFSDHAPSCHPFVEPSPFHSSCRFQIIVIVILLNSHP